MRPFIAIVLLAALCSFASAAFLATFASVDEPFYAGEAGRVELNASCWGYDNEYMMGELVRFKVEAVYPPFNATTLLKQSFLVYVEPCEEIKRQVFLLEFPLNASAVNIKISFARADYPLGYFPIAFQQSFVVKEKPKPANASAVSGELLEGSLTNLKLPKPDWIWIVGVAAAVLALILLLYFRALKLGFLFLVAAAIALGYYSFA